MENKASSNDEYSYMSSKFHNSGILTLIIINHQENFFVSTEHRKSDGTYQRKMNDLK